MNDVAGIYARESDALDRYVQVALAQGRVISVSFPTAPEPNADRDHALLDRIEAYLAGERDAFDDVQVALTVPTDQREVLDVVRTVPYGEAATVDQLARMTPGRDPEDDHTTAIRGALTANPTPLLIPTHRVRDAAGSAPSRVAETLRAVEGI
jgi:methylated-DNA-[protein]-cysteine S-methyltransferase